MRKKLFALALGLIAATSIIAQSTDSTQTGTPVEATIDSSEILYWVGSGENSAILAVNWLDTALAWGYRWSGTATVQSMLYGIASADTRFSVYIYSTNLNNINYHEGAVNLTLSPNSFWRDRLNGGYCQGLSQSLANGDFVKCADYNAHITTDSTYNETYPGYGYWSYNEVYATPIHPATNPNSGIDTTSGGNTDTIPGGGGGVNDSISGGGTDSTGFGSVYHLSVHSSNSALGCVLGGGDYPAGSQVVLYAVPKAGKVFNMWTGPDTLGSSNIVSTSNPYTVTVNGNISLFASFSECAGTTHDTIYIGNEGIDSVQTANIRLYQRDGRIVVENCDAMPLPAVVLFDAAGRKRETLPAGSKASHVFDVPVSGVYLIKVGEQPARRVVVIR